MFAFSTIGVCFSFDVHCLTINKFPMTGEQSLYFKLVYNVHIDQIDEVFHFVLEITLSITK